MNFKKMFLFSAFSLLVIALSFTTCLTPSAFAISTQSRKLKVLAIGNSFSEDSTSWLYQIAEAANAESVVIGNLYIGGCSLETHRNNAMNNSAAYEYQKNSDGTWVKTSNTTMEFGITDEDWDVISIQQVSGLSGISSTYNGDIDYLIDYINSKKTNAAAKIAWHMTWAYQSNSTHSDFAKYDNSQETMYLSIVNAVKDCIVTNSKIDIILPTGTAIQNVRTSYLGDALTRDGFHLSYNLGRYIAAMTWLKAITGWSIDDIGYVPCSSEILSSDLPLIKEAVNNAVACPFEVSPSSYKTEPPLDCSMYTQKIIKVVSHAYWDSVDGAFSVFPTVTTRSDNSKYFIASAKRFTKDDLPTGTVIEIDEGYQYRPDGWTYFGDKAPGRPSIVTVGRIIITDDFWANYKYRAFNISYLGGDTDVADSADEIMTHFRIYVPIVSQGDDNDTTSPIRIILSALSEFFENYVFAPVKYLWTLIKNLH